MLVTTSPERRPFAWGTCFTYVVIAGLAIVLSIRPAPLASESLTGVRTAGAHTTHVATPSSPYDSSARTLDWRTLSQLDYVRGAVPPNLAALHGQRVRIPGFIVPLDDFQEDVKEFLLVPYFGACVHMPPPPPNQMVFTRMRSTTRVSLWDPVWIEGELLITKIKSPYGVVSYQLRGQRITPYR